MDTARITFEPDGATVDALPGTTVHSAAAEAGIALEAPCGGLGTCGRCRVRASGGLSDPDFVEREALSADDLASGVRLACRARVAGAATIVRATSASSLRVETGGLPRTPVVAPGRTGLGVALDIGTTTLAAAIYDLSDGRRRATASALNPQTAFGHDIMTRVSRALDGDAEAMRASVADEVSRLVHRLLESAGGSSLAGLVIVGNPTMIHLLLGRDVSPLGFAPYEGAHTDAVESTAGELKLPGPADLGVFIAPGVSAFVGADAVAGVVSTGLAGRDYPSLLMDLGTNGELVLWAGGRMLATSAAVGPALEGVTISSGMRAESGAIERVRLEDGRLDIATIDGAAARGVCGSGLLDAIAAMLDAGVLDAGGRMIARGRLGDRVSSDDSGERFELADGVSLTQLDIRQVQLAKGAVAVAADILLEEAGIDARDVREVLIGGGFGSRVAPSSLVRLGVLPPEWADRVTFCGNTALSGAAVMLLDPTERARAASEASQVRTVPLASRPDFERRFLSALDFPADL